MTVTLLISKISLHFSSLREKKRSIIQTRNQVIIRSRRQHFNRQTIKKKEKKVRHVSREINALVRATESIATGQ